MELASKIADQLQALHTTFWRHTTQQCSHASHCARPFNLVANFCQVSLTQDFAGGMFFIGRLHRLSYEARSDWVTHDGRGESEAEVDSQRRSQ